jgi:hypothetical protein
MPATKEPSTAGPAQTGVCVGPAPPREQAGGGPQGPAVPARVASPGSIPPWEGDVDVDAEETGYGYGV